MPEGFSSDLSIRWFVQPAARYLLVCGTLLLMVVFSVRSGDVSAETTTPTTNTTVAISEQVVLPDAKRLGINLGSHDHAGASQILKNVIVNPGFESGEFATVLLTEDGASADMFQQDNWNPAWNNDAASIGQQPGFWDGAQFEIVTGSAAGRMGSVISFTHDTATAGGYPTLYTYNVTPVGTVPNDSSLVTLRTTLPGFVNEQSDTAIAIDTARTRPGSSGSQSLRLTKRAESWRPSHRYYFDQLQSIDASAGQMVTVEGHWCVDIWARSQYANDEFNLYFWRQGYSQFFFNSSYESLTSTWKKFSFDFTVAPGDDSPGSRFARSVPDPDLPIGNSRELRALDPFLELGIRVGIDNSGDVWIDDMSMYRCDDTNPTAFTDKFVNLMRDLNPEVLRDWGLQLGATLDNQLADEFGRKTTGFSPKERKAKQWHYSLHEFLELAKEIDAEPWYTIPPTFTQEEMENLSAYLGAPASSHPYSALRASMGQSEPWTDVFPVIHLEYGNEMWGSNSGSDPFLGATARGGARLGQLAENRFSAFKSTPWGNSPVYNRIVGAQVGNPYTVREIVENSDEQNAVAFAPYFGYDIDYATTDEELYYPIYARIFQDLGANGLAETMQGYIDNYGQNEELTIYEINFHTSHGNASLSDRNDFVSGLNGGLTLPLYMLSYQRDAGVRTQTAFRAAQYSVQVGGTAWAPEMSRMWGMLRDVETTSRKRPTWLGLEAVNRAIMGDFVETTHSGDDPTYTVNPMGELEQIVNLPLIQSFAFKDGDDMSLVLFNLNLNDAETIIIDTPFATDPVATRHVLTSASIHDDNETASNINISTSTITNFSDGYSVTMPPNSLYVFEFEKSTLVLPNKVYLPMIIKPGGTPLSVVEDGDLEGEEISAETPNLITTQASFIPTGHSRLTMRLFTTIAVLAAPICVYNRRHERTDNTHSGNRNLL